MARPLSGKTNVVAPGGSYPYGRVRDNDGTGNGTNVNENLVGDLIQFFEKLLADGGVTANGNPENSSDGFQYAQALTAIINSLAGTLISAEASTRASADTTLQNNINSEASTRGTDDTTLQNNINAEASTRGSADTTLQNNINLKADIASPALTGNPTAPTQSPGNNSTRIATTAYADAVGVASVAAEAAIRAAADTALQNNINAITAQNASGLITTLINIGDWDMDTSGNTFVAHGLTDSKIVSVEVLIRADASDWRIPLAAGGYSEVDFAGLNPGTVQLVRNPSGYFDNSNYSSLSYNRGFVVIRSTP